MSLEELLQWLLSSGGSVITASWIFERIPWFQSQTPEKKEWLFFAVSTLIAIFSYFVINFVPKEYIDAISPYFSVIAGSFYAVDVGKMFHSVDKNNSGAQG